MGSAKKGAKLEIPPQLLAKRYSFPLSSGGCLANVIVVPPRKRNCQRYDRKEEEDDRKRLSRFSLLAQGPSCTHCQVPGTQLGCTGMEVLRRARGLTRNMDVQKGVGQVLDMAASPRQPATAGAPSMSVQTSPAVNNSNPLQQQDPEKERLRYAVELLRAENDRLRAKLSQIAALATP